MVLGIKEKIPRPFGLRAKLYVPHFGGLNFFLKLHAVARFKRHVQQRILNQTLFASTENSVLYKRDFQNIFRLCSTKHEKLRDLYLSPIIIRAMKSKSVRWAGHVAHVGREKCLLDLSGKT